ncbi:MAG TPA: NAD(P)-dependent oxidoreductase [Candidatus Binatia bacterium]|jgi:nucleoside-diphosphate-sugar epimerase
MKVVVTGGAGRLGQYAIQELLQYGFDVLTADIVQSAKNLCRFVAADLGNAESLQEIFAGADAVVHLARRRFPYTENGFDPASGTWKTPDVIGDARRFNDNTAMTYNVLTAAIAAGAKKIVAGSSLAVYGLFYPPMEAVPDYLPVDEDHPCRPHDPYGLSKLVGEAMCDSLGRKAEVQIASLRFSGIYAGESARVLAERRKNPIVRGAGALWSYVDVRDAATACRLGLQADFQGHEAFNVCAPTTIMDEPTEDLIRRYLPKVKSIRARGQANWCGYDTKKAETMLGFRARHLFNNGTLQ